MGTQTVAVVPEPVKKWLEDLTGAEVEAKAAKQRQTADNKALSEVTEGLFEGQQMEKIRAGLDFGMEKMKDPSILGKLKELMNGGPGEMRSLDKNSDAMNEIDTHEDLPALMSISPEDLKKAGEALRMVKEASDNAKEKLRQQRYDELKWDPTKVKKLREEHEEEKKKAAKGEKPEGEPNPDLEKLKAIDIEVDGAVAREIWTPLVRAGAVPENLVPDNFSEVKRTFQAASKEYQARLEEYSKGGDDNQEMLRKLDVAGDILDKVNNLGKAVGGLLPKDAQVHLNTACDLLKIVSTTTVTAVKLKVQDKDAQDIVDAVAKGVGSICKTSLEAAGNKTVGTIVETAMTGAIASGRAVRGIVDKKPENVLNSLADALNSALSAAAAATGIKELTTVAPAAISALKVGGTIAKMKTAMDIQDPIKRKAAMETAMNECLKQSMDALSKGVQLTISTVATRDKELGKKSETINTAIDIGMTGASGVIIGALSEDKLKGITAALGTVANSSCSKFIEPKALGTAIGGLVGPLITAGGSTLKKGLEDKDPEAVLKVLGDAVVKGVATGLAAKKVDGELSKKITEEVANTIKTATEANALRKAVKSGSLKDINDALKGLMDSVSVHISSTKDFIEAAKGIPKDKDGEGDKGGEKSDGKSADDKKADAAKKEDEAIVEKLRATLDKAQTILDDPSAQPGDKKKAQEAKDKAIKEIVDQSLIKAELEAEPALFLEKLNATFGEQNDDPDNEDALPKLQEMIMQLQKDRKIFDLVNNLSSMPIAIAAKFFPPAGAALDFKTFGVEVAKAVQHTRALLQWLDNEADARAAVSVQVHAMLSRVGMEKRQLVEHNIRAALALTSALGQVLAVAGVAAAPVGAAMTAASKVGEAGLELAKKIFDETTMAQAWAIYQEAAANPANRKKARMAIQSNPTLAKYALAWGALEGGDRIAKNALKKCGLTDAVLGQKDANVKDVVTYLEEMFSEDLVVLRTVPVKKAWHPEGTKPALTLRSWTAYLAGAVKTGDLADGSGGSVTEGFVRLDKAEAGYTKAQATHEDTKAALDEHVIQQKKLEALAAANSMTAEDITNPGKKPPEVEKKVDAVGVSLQKKYDTATEELETAKKELTDSVTAVQKATQRFSPKTKGGEAHEEMRSYLDSLVALGEVRLRELKGETIALSKAA